MSERRSAPITAGERRFPIAVAVVMLALTLVPLLVGLLLQPHDEIFSWFVVQARDAVSYVAKTNEGLLGHWLYHDPYTSEPHPESLVYAPYVLLGQADRILHLPVTLLIHLARLALGAALVWAVYLLAAEAFPDQFRRRLGFLLVLLGGGIAIIAKQDILGYHLLSLDRAVVGTAGMETISNPPHIILVCLGGAWLALILIRHQRNPRARDLLAAFLWTLAISLVYPQMGVMWALIGLVVIVTTGRPRPGPLLMAIAILSAAAPYAIYGAYLRLTNPIFSHWPPDSDIAIGDPLSYLLWGHLLMVPLIVVAITLMFRRRHASEGWREGAEQVPPRPLRLMLTWIAVSTVLMYAPGAPSLFHRVYYGSFIPFGMLAAYGFAHALERFKGLGRRRLLVYGTLAMSLITIANFTQNLGIPVQHLDDYSLYYPRPEAHVLETLRDRDPRGGKLLMNAFLSGLWVPAISYQTTYLGFPFETLDHPRKELVAEQFYRLNDAQAIRSRAAELGFDYMMWGKYEAGFGGQDPGRLAGWEVVAEDGRARIYRVTTGMP